MNLRASALRRGCRWNLDILGDLTIMQAFLAPWLYDARRIAADQAGFFKILRAKDHAGAKSTPNTPYNLQETT